MKQLSIDEIFQRSLVIKSNPLYKTLQEEDLWFGDSTDEHFVFQCNSTFLVNDKVIDKVLKWIEYSKKFRTYPIGFTIWIRSIVVYTHDTKTIPSW